MGPIKFLYNNIFDFTAKSLVTNTVVISRVLRTYTNFLAAYAFRSCALLLDFLEIIFCFLKIIIRSPALLFRSLNLIFLSLRNAYRSHAILFRFLRKVFCSHGLLFCSLKDYFGSSEYYFVPAHYVYVPSIK